MNFEPKVTDRAAFVALWHNGELLVLQSRKWQTEGTPYLLPGGGLKRPDEPLKSRAAVEFFEETGIALLKKESLSFFGEHETEWTKATFFEADTKTAKCIDGGGIEKIGNMNIEDKIFGHEWWNFEKDRTRIEALKPFMMPGLKWYLAQKGLL